MIYLDNAATTLPYKDCIEKAAKFNENSFFNASALYRGGILNANEIKSAKNSILKFLGVSSDNYEVVFTSCGTESDNLAIFGAVSRGVFVTDSGEHSAVHNSFKELQNKGHQVYFCNLNGDGSVNTENLYETVKKYGADFVSVMHVNNETGAINDVNKISEELKKINPKIIFHSDGVQSFGKIPFNLSKYVDLYSVSAHKINALKGVGALIKRKNLNVKPLIIGGGQENGLRSGTENVFGIKVFEYAAEKHFKTIRQDYDKALSLKKYFIENLDGNIFKIISAEGSPYVLSVAAKGLRGETIMHCLEEKDIIVGNGSACSSKNRVSRTLTACGIKPPYIDGAVRISFSSESTMEEAKKAVDIISETVFNLKRMME